MQLEAYLLTPGIMIRSVAVPGARVVIGALLGGTPTEAARGTSCGANRCLLIPHRQTGTHPQQDAKVTEPWNHVAWLSVGISVQFAARMELLSFLAISRLGSRFCIRDPHLGILGFNFPNSWLVPEPKAAVFNS